MTRRYQEIVGRWTTEMVPPGRRRRGRLNVRWMDYVNRDMRTIGTIEDEVRARTGWIRIVSTAAIQQYSGRVYKKKSLVVAIFQFKQAEDIKQKYEGLRAGVV